MTTILTELNGGVAIVTLNRPEALNAFNLQQRDELLSTVKALNENADVRTIILTGAGRAFSAGADLAEQLPADQTVEQRLNEQYKPILTGIAESTKIWIAAVNGVAAGIGSSFALSCDLVVMQTDASFYLAFSSIGLIPDGGLSLQMQRQLGKKKAF